MASNSSIEWTESTWNPVTGCAKVSPGCQNCYAERMAKRLLAMGQPNYKNGFKLTTHEHALELPLKWKKPQTIFVNSMSDLFHQNVGEDFILRVFDVMNRTPWHTFQVLTKRAERLAEISSRLEWGKNIWMGVSVESADYKSRIDYLRKTEAQVKFISFEPLIDRVGKVDLRDIDWAIVGGESGHGQGTCRRNGLRTCGTNAWLKKSHSFLSSGAALIRRTGRLLDGRTWDDMPSVAEYN